jgi:broad specificity phosphatase PhoE
VLAVTHRGFIMELMNVVNYLNDGTEPIYKEISGNCSITILRISRVSESTDLQNMKIEIVCANDSSHCNKLN